MKHRTALTTLLLPGVLLATATPADAQAVLPVTQGRTSDAPDRAPGARVWAPDAFPEGTNVGLQDAARGGGRATWAVGARQTGQGRGTTVTPVAFIRDGADRSWHELALPRGLEASAIAPDGADGTWVTGSGQGGSVPVGRYRAGRWQVQDAPLPEHSMGGGIRALAAAGGPDDVWAVGHYQPDDYLTFYGVIEHWNGESWERVPTLDLGTDYWTLADVVATGPSDVWAAGSLGTPDGWTSPLLLHYDGHAWSKVAAPDLDSRYGELTRLVAAGPGDVWAVGTESGPTRQDRVLAAHFDGRAWTRQETGLGAGRLDGATRTPGGIAVVGHTRTGSVYQPIGAQLTSRGWQPLDLPQSSTVGGRIPRSVVTDGNRLTVVGLDATGKGADGEPLPPQPFSVSG
ncbi:hypothetical protein [Kitasatospora terrestris]|uniref:Secreted protein n=1 Tax=Kitasatospora terrestris TaxID=258051 RepID=A0ABP9DFH5_9ACTN